ncbi:hypothetical protein EJB05_57123, partial [Eragrostis curvula]
MAVLDALAAFGQWPLVSALLLPALRILYLLVLALWRSSKQCQRHHPPSPRGLPVIGNLHQLGALPHRSLHALARTHGPMMLLRLGRVPAVVVSTPELAREVMRTRDADCCSRPGSPGPRRLSYGLKNVAFAPYDDYWREMRKLFVVEMLRAKRVQSIWHARETQVDKMIGNLERAQGQPANLSEEIFAHVDAIIGMTAFGSVFSAEDFFPNAAGRLVDRLTGMAARRERCFRDLDGFFQMVIDQHLDPARPRPPEQGGGDLVDALIAVWKEQRDGVAFDQDNIKGMIL